MESYADMQESGCKKDNNVITFELLLNTQREFTKMCKFKDKIIVLLIVCMCLESLFCYGGFVWYESQFDYENQAKSKTVEMNVDGEGNDAVYNDVLGNQYNDNAKHCEGGEVNDTDESINQGDKDYNYESKDTKVSKEMP